MAQRLVALQAPPCARQQPEAVVEPIADLRRAHRHHPGRRQLDRQRDAVEAPADLGRPRARRPASAEREAAADRAGPLDEQRDRRGRRPRRRRRAAGRATAARRRGRAPRATSPAPSTVRARARIASTELGGRVEHVLAVVEHDQQPPAGQRLGDAVGHRRRPAWGVTPSAVATASATARGVAHRRQLDQPHAVGELGRQLGGDLDAPGGSCRRRRRRSASPAGGPAPARASASTSASRPTKLVDCTGQVPGHGVDGPQRRELRSRRPSARTWKICSGVGEVAQAVLARGRPGRRSVDQRRPSMRPRGSARRGRPPSPAPPGSAPVRSSRPLALRASPVAMPIRTGSCSARWASTAASTAARGRARTRRRSRRRCA